MQVVACTGGRDLRVERREVPEAGPGEVVLGLLACGLCGTDLFKIDAGLTHDGLVLGHEVVGVVLERGAGAEVAVGDRVVVPHHVACGVCALCRRGSRTLCATFKENLMDPGGLAERVRIGSRAVSQALWRVPDHVSDGAAVFLEPAACVLRGLDKAGLTTSDGCAVVLGAGSMGLLHLLVLQAAHPGVRVVVCDPEPARCRVADGLGAAATTAPCELAPVVETVSGGLGADAIFDTVGGAGPLGQGLAVARSGGTVVLFAHAGEGELAGFELNPFFKNERRVVATYSGTVEEQRRVACWLADGRLDPTPLISHRLPLADTSQGFELMRRRQALKILVAPEVG